MTLIYKLFGIRFWSHRIAPEELPSWRIRVGHYKRCWWNPLTLETRGYDPMDAFKD